MANLLILPQLHEGESFQSLEGFAFADLGAESRELLSTAMRDSSTEGSRKDRGWSA